MGSSLTKNSFSLLSLILLAYFCSNINANKISAVADFEGISLETDISNTESFILPKRRMYEFANTTLALKALTELDIFEPVDESYFKTRFETRSRYDKPFLGLKSDDEYCKNHRAYFVEHPEIIFNQTNLFVQVSPLNFVRSVVVPKVGTDIMPHVSSAMPLEQSSQPLYDLDVRAGIFSTVRAFFVSKHIGKHFSCLSQMSNHIPGHQIMNRKDYVATAVTEYAKKFQDRPQCFPTNKLFPKTWILTKQEECLDFFRILDSAQYKEEKDKSHVVYIRKIAVGSHGGKGVQTVNAEEEATLRQTYANGTLCGAVPQKYIIQEYVQNPLLLNGRKFDFRMFLLIASSNPLIAYYYDGGLRVSLIPYNVESDDKKVFLTNIALSHDIYHNAREGQLYEGMDEEALKHAQQWDFERLQAYLLEAGVINDPNWLDNYLRPQFKKAMIHLVRMASPAFLENSSLFELYGADYMLDADLNLWFVEANSGPAFGGFSKNYC